MPCFKCKLTFNRLMHDVGDHKYQKPEENPENQIAEALLEQGADPVLAMKVQLVCKNVSYSNEVKNPRMMRAVLDTHPELGVVQDADRLDAIGVIGIGRTFTFGGAKQPNRDMEGTLRHFVDKLERLEGMMKVCWSLFAAFGFALLTVSRLKRGRGWLGNGRRGCESSASGGMRRISYKFENAVWYESPPCSAFGLSFFI